jgi:hypothetical protein
MKALSQGYKRMLGMDDFAFYFVQLANWGALPTSPTPVLSSGGWDADTRIQQANAMSLPHSGMASALDIGDSADMHPLDKLDVGERLALWALKNDYGLPITATSGPILKDVTVSGSTLVCSFDHIGSGLMVGSKTPYQPTAEIVGGTLQKFSIAGASGPWHEATATIVGNTVVVSSPAVSAPAKVAYACWQNPVGCNLYNREGLPASPFYVDDVNAKFTVTATAGTGGGISPAGATTFLKRRTALYIITPDPGFFVQDVKVDGVSVGAPKYYTFDPIYAHHTIEATFATSAPAFTIAATASPGGTISPNGNVGVTQGGSRTFTLDAPPGAIVNLAVDGRSLGRRNSHTFADVRENHTIDATFTFPINAQAGYGGSITPTGMTVVTYGGSQTYQIVPQTGFAISKVTVDGVNVGAVESHTFENVTSSHSITATFTGTGGSGSVPQTGKIHCSFLTDNLPASGNITSWASYLPPGRTLTPQGTPEVVVIDERKFVRNISVESDGLDMGTVAAPIPCTGATIVTVVKPVRLGSDPGWTSIVDLFYDRLVLGILNGSGRVVVIRNGSLEKSTATIPDGQTTILSLVVQQNGTYKVYANGTQVMDVSASSDMSSIVPGVAGGFANHITFGRNWPDGWTTYNGYFGDSFVYTTALSDAERQQLETYLVNRLTASGPTFTINASAGAGGSISPSGAVAVASGGSQTFTITPDAGHAISAVTVDGAGVGAVASHSFTDVTANHTITAAFVPTGNTPSGDPEAVSLNVGGFDTNHDVTGSLGVVSVANWNNLTNIANPSAVNLMDNSGSATTLDITFAGWNKDTFNSWGDSRANLYSNFLHHQGDTLANGTVNISQIPYGSYDVYIYYTGFVSKQVQAWTDGDTTLYGLRGPASGGGLNGYVQYQTASEATALADAAGGTAGGNYLKFTGLTGSSLTLTSLGLPDQAGFEQDGLAGIQIVNTTPSNTYATWISGFPGVGSANGFNDDADGDGIKNGLENHMGTDPSKSSAGLTSVSATGSIFKFQHTRSNTPASDITAIYQWSTDLANWYATGQSNGQGVAATITSTIIADTDAPDNDLVEVMVTLNEGDPSSVFARIEGIHAP